MLTGLVIAVGLGVIAQKTGQKWINEFVMALSMIGGMASSLLWVKVFG